MTNVTRLNREGGADLPASAAGIEPRQPDRPVCRNCKAAALSPDFARIVFWRDEGLVVIRNIPALTCQSCGEEFISDAAVLRLDRMRGDGFHDFPQSGQMTVPVIDFASGVLAEAARMRSTKP